MSTTTSCIFASERTVAEPSQSPTPGGAPRGSRLQCPPRPERSVALQPGPSVLWLSSPPGPLGWSYGSLYHRVVSDPAKAYPTRKLYSSCSLSIRKTTEAKTIKLSAICIQGNGWQHDLKVSLQSDPFRMQCFLRNRPRPLTVTTPDPHGLSTSFHNR